MQIVRVLDLKDSKGVRFLESEDIDELLKQAVFYLDKKTTDLKNSEFLEWLQDKAVNGSFGYEDRITLENDVYTPEFAFMSKNTLKLGVLISELIDNLAYQNGLTGEMPEYLITKE